MKIAITGSTGFLARALIPALEADGHQIIRVVRPASSTSDGIAWDPDAGTIDAAAFEDLDVVINLAGRGIGQRRYSDAEKARLWRSRVDGTALLARTLAERERRPSTLINASAIGYYGERGANELTEDSGPGHGFLADLCVAWEQATAPAEDAGIRVVIPRTGIVLGHGGPLFKRLIPAFKMGVGGRLGDGTQYQSWISIDDHVAAMRHLVSADVAGPINLVAPEPVTNAELVRAIGATMRRPSFMAVPRAALAVILGRELVDDLLASQRVRADRLIESGFSFAHPTLKDALRAIFA